MQSLKRRHYESYLLWGQLQLHDGGPEDKLQAEHFKISTLWMVLGLTYFLA